MSTLRATYRLQFEPSFRFADAAALGPALSDLGISHVYTSPVFEAVPGSRHGYDVVDPEHVREELGGEVEWRRLVAALASQGLGVLVDVVPNHLAISRNPWWFDVLEHGRRSPYFTYFDLTFDEDSEPATIVIPLLAEPYGEELEAGRIALVHEDGRIKVAYGDERFPLSPESLAAVGADDRAAAPAIVERLNGDRERLHQLLEAQHYRLAWWQLARDESPYRRFFDVNALIATRVERDEVFEALHRLPRAWVRDGLVDGLRIDHVDGLADPAAYLHRLRGELPEAWIGVEKILAPDEPWPGWPVDGTTGYEFGALVTRLFTAPDAEAPLTAFHETFTGLSDRYEDVARESKHEMLGHWLRGDAERVATILHQRCQQDIQLRDYSQRDCLLLVQELVARAPVYRTYVAAGRVEPRDAAILQEMFDGLRQARPDLPAPLIAFAAGLCLDPPDAESAFVTRLQQLCTTVAAKGIEDTAFYRYTRFIAHNDVGGDPGRFSQPVEAFHDAARRWQREQPRGLRNTSTHDSKRSEDVRVRLTLISERVEEWIAQVTAWHERTARLRVDGQPDANFEYYLYQTLVGAWPLSRERVHVHAEKAVREAKLFTNWTTPSAEYEHAVHRVIDGLYDDERFLREVEAFVAALHPGDWHKCLAQVLLKITTPGVPDFYHGAHGWLLTLSDPDNRRPVDFGPLEAALASLDSLTAEEVVARMNEGLPKLWITRRALALRRRHPGLAPSASYEPMAVGGGADAAHIVAFLRGGDVAVIVPTRAPASGWCRAHVGLPAGTWTDVLTDRDVPGGEQPVGALWRIFPVALLERRAA